MGKSGTGFYKRYSIDKGTQSRDSSKDNRNGNQLRSSASKDNFETQVSKVPQPQNNFYRTFTGKFKLLGTPTSKDPSYRMGIQSRGSLLSGGNLGISSREDLFSGPRSSALKESDSHEFVMESETKDSLSQSSKFKKKGYEKFTISNKLKMNTQEQFFKKKLHNAIQRAEAFIAEDEKQEMFRREDEDEEKRFVELYMILDSLF